MSATVTPLDRLIRVRRIRERLAMADLARAQGRADAMVDVAESVVIPMRNFQGVQWKILDEVLASFWVGIGVQKGNTALRDVLNVVLFELHRTNFVNQTWEKWFGVPMTTRIPFNPMF
jgi:polar amino acid transport system substrate-binding protein